MDYGRVKRINTALYKRVIAVSDIHGSYALLVRLLDRVRFSKEDALILLGDYIEKGPHSLATLRLAMELTSRGNAYALAGNCDTIIDDFRAARYKWDVTRYMLWRKNSIFVDMARELGLDYVKAGPDGTLDMIEEAFPSEVAWLRALPDIIETEKHIFVHAGIDSEDLSHQDRKLCHKRDGFVEEGRRFKKTVVVGHLPTPNYARFMGGKMSCMPYYDEATNIYSIDGGNAVKSAGQLNALIYESGAYTAEYVDSLPVMRVTGAQAETEDFVTISWNHSEVEVIRDEGTRALCRAVCTGSEVWLDKANLYEEDGVLHSSEFTNYRDELHAGDEVSLVKYGEITSIIKKNGVISAVPSSLLTNR